MSIREEGLSDNSRRVLRAIWKNDGISRIEIAGILNLDKSTITKITNKLIREKHIFTTEMGDPGPLGGRRPIGLSLEGDRGYFLGIELRTEQCVGMVIDLKGNIIGEYILPYEGNGFDDAINSVINLVKGVSADKPLKAVGIGLPGIIDYKEKIVLKSYPLNIEEPIDLNKKLSHILSCPFLIENDANCGCWSELVAGRESKTGNMIYMTGTLDRKKKIDLPSRGSGIGIGILMNGRVLHGTGYSAGEFRSTYLEDNYNDQLAGEKTDDRLDELARNMAMIINTFNVNEMVLGGGFAQYGEKLLKLFALHADRNWAYEGPAKCVYRYSRYGERDVAYGAAAMCLDQYFS